MMICVVCKHKACSIIAWKSVACMLAIDGAIMITVVLSGRKRVQVRVTIDRVHVVVRGISSSEC